MVQPHLIQTQLPEPPPRPFPIWPLCVFLGVIGIWSTAHHLSIDFQALLWGAGDMAEYIGRFGRPEIANFPRIAKLMAETLAMAVWGTAMALILALILAPLAARNLSPHPVLYRAARELLNGLRALPDLLFASIFVAALGLGPLPGVLAIGLHSAGFLGKVLAEILERVEQDKLSDEARATSRKWQNNYDDEKRSVARICAEYYDKTGYFTALVSSILEDSDYIPPEKAWRKMCENKYAKKVLALHQMRILQHLQQFLALQLI